MKRVALILITFFSWLINSPAFCAEEPPSPIKPNPDCDQLIQKMPEAFSGKDVLCLTSISNEIGIWNQLEDGQVLLVHNLIDFELDTRDLLEITKEKSFALVIDGICAGKCSRLLMPLASEISFTSGSFAALTDSSIESRISHSAKQLFGKKGENFRLKLSRDEVEGLHPSYARQIENEYSLDLKLIAQSDTSVSHLNWHSSVRQILKYNDDTQCWPINFLAVILTPDYLHENGLGRLNGSHSIPIRQEILKVVERELGDFLVIYSYDTEPLNQCLEKPKTPF